MAATDLLARFRAHVTRSGLFVPSGRVVVAVSGGADSLALLHLLHAVADAHRLELHVGHVEHGIHPAGDDWAAMVRTVADDLRLPFHLERLALGSDASETEARAARYPALRRIQRAVAAAYLATAHQASDQAETVLFRFLRGSGPAGLAGIPARGPGGLRRPLLPYTRDELRAWLATAAPTATPVEDPANEHPRHDRVWIRQVVLPELRRRFPDVERSIRSGARQAARNREAWDALVLSDPHLRLSRTEAGVEVEREPFGRYDNALSEAILRAVCRAAGSRPPGERLAALVEFTRVAPSGRRLDLGSGWVAEAAFGRLRIGARSEVERAVPRAAVWGAGDAGETSWGPWGITWRREPAGRVERRSWSTWVQAEQGRVRAAGTGDSLRPVGGVGRRPVRRLLMEARVPRAERVRYPVIVDDARILWIPGVCRASAAVPRPGEPAVRLDVRRLGSP